MYCPDSQGKDMTKIYFNPGCALSIYKPQLRIKYFVSLMENYGKTLLHKIRCHHGPKLKPGSVIIDALCPGWTGVSLACMKV